MNTSFAETRASTPATSFSTDDDSWDAYSLDWSQAVTSFDKAATVNDTSLDRGENSGGETDDDEANEHPQHYSTAINSHSDHSGGVRYNLRSSGQLGVLRIDGQDVITSFVIDPQQRLDRSTPPSKDPRTSSEHFLVRDLPHHGLFVKPFPSSMSRVTQLPVRWEYARLASFLSSDLETLTRHKHFKGNLTDLDDLLASHEQNTKFNHSTGLLDPFHNDIDIVYKAKLVFASGAVSRDHLFSLDLQSLQKEKTSRLQRGFRGRFLTVDVPDMRGLGEEYTTTFNKRFHEWLCSEKEFLGYKWRAFHVQQIKAKARSKKNPIGGQRVVFYATHGHGIGRVDLQAMLDWTLPFAQNLHQSYCKAFARLDLFLSQTTPTLKFKASQVRFVRDVFADGRPEALGFNETSRKAVTTTNHQ